MMDYYGALIKSDKMFTQPSDLREEAKNELLKEVKGLLAMRAMVRKEVLEEVNFNYITIMTNTITIVVIVTFFNVIR